MLLIGNTDIKGTWVGIDDAEQYYNPILLTAVKQNYQQLKQTYRHSPQDKSDLGAIASQLQTDLANLSPDVYPENDILAREVRFYSLHLCGQRPRFLKTLQRQLKFWNPPLPRH